METIEIIFPAFGSNVGGIILDGILFVSCNIAFIQPIIIRFNLRDFKITCKLTSYKSADL